MMNMLIACSCYGRIRFIRTEVISQRAAGMKFIRDMMISGSIGSNDYPKAIRACEAALEKNPDDEDARWSLANCLYWSGEYEKAIYSAKHLLKRGREESDVAVLLARCYSQLGEHELGYDYACLAMEVAFEPVPELPKILRWVPFIKNAMLMAERRNWRELKWANQYKLWCEKCMR